MPSEKQAYELAQSLLKDFVFECIAEEATRQNLSPSIREKCRLKRLPKSKSSLKTSPLIGRGSPTLDIGDVSAAGLRILKLCLRSSLETGYERSIV
jgi:hypothetical protein